MIWEISGTLWFLKYTIPSSLAPPGTTDTSGSQVDREWCWEVSSVGSRTSQFGRCSSHWNGSSSSQNWLVQIRFNLGIPKAPRNEKSPTFWWAPWSCESCMFFFPIKSSEFPRGLTFWLSCNQTIALFPFTKHFGLMLRQNVNQVLLRCSRDVGRLDW